MRAFLPLIAAVAVAGCLAVDSNDAPLLAAPASGGDGDGAPTRLDVVAAADAPGGYALRVWEDRAYVATFTSEEGVSVFDVGDPAHPVQVGGLLGQFARSVDVLDYGARVAVAISTGDALKVFDVTDPLWPTELASFGFRSHNVIAYREAGVVYNARNAWDGVNAVEIVDARDPTDIRLAGVFEFPLVAADGSVVANSGCHDVVIVHDALRAYCAAYEQTLIWDVTDPFAPVVLTAITNPAIAVHHSAFPILGGDVLVIGDEFAGNLAWGCLGHPAPPPASDAPTPAGALWFYDLTKSPPEPIAWVGAPPTPPDPRDPRVTGALCTSHNGEEMPEHPGVIAYGWFHAGVVLIDATDPREPVVLDRADVGGAVGDARFHEGFVLAADDEVGLTVLKAAFD